MTVSTTKSMENELRRVNKRANKAEKAVTGEIEIAAHSWFGDFVKKHEVPRKVFHSSIGFFTLWLYTEGIYYRDVLPPLVTLLLLVGVADLLRLNSSAVNKLYCHVMGPLMRESEIHNYNGVIFYLMGVIFAFYFFPKDISVIAVCLLSWSDTAASTCGRKWGYLTPKLARNKSLAGSIAAFVVGVATCAIFYGYFIPAYPQVNTTDYIMWTPETSKLSLLGVSVAGGFVAAFGEGIDLFNWDDNFTIPVLTSIFMYCVLTVARV